MFIIGNWNESKVVVQTVLPWSLNSHWLSPFGSVEHKGGMEDVELLFLSKRQIIFQNSCLSLFWKSEKIISKLLFKKIRCIFFNCYLIFWKKYYCFSHLDQLISKSIFFEPVSLFQYHTRVFISVSYQGMSSSRTKIVLLCIHNLANSMNIFVNNKLASFNLPWLRQDKSK